MNCFPPSPSAIFFHFATCNSKLSIGGSAERVEAVPRSPETWKRVEPNDGVALFIVVPLASASLLNHSDKTPSTAKRAADEPSGLASNQPINYSKDGPSSTVVTQRGTNCQPCHSLLIWTSPTGSMFQQFPKQPRNNRLSKLSQFVCGHIWDFRRTKMDWAFGVHIKKAVQPSTS